MPFPGFATPEQLAAFAKDVIPRLRSSLLSLNELASSVLHRTRYKTDDDFQFMALTFASKQVDHADAVLRLDGHPDSELVCRSMLEGLSQLKWAAIEPPERSHRWRTFAFVVDWRTMRAWDEEGTPVEPDRRARVQADIDTHGGQFFNAKARNAISRGAPMPSDPYAAHWYDIQIKQMFDAVGDSVLYSRVYNAYSAWHHWSPAGLARAIKQSDAATGYNAHSSITSAGALAVAFQCLYETVSLCNQHLALGLENPLQAIFDAYVIATADPTE